MYRPTLTDRTYYAVNAFVIGCTVLFLAVILKDLGMALFVEKSYLVEHISLRSLTSFLAIAYLLVYFSDKRKAEAPWLYKPRKSILLFIPIVLALDTVYNITIDSTYFNEIVAPASLINVAVLSVIGALYLIGHKVKKKEQENR